MTYRADPRFLEPLESRLLLSAGPAEPPVTWIPSPNFNSRNGTKIDAIVIHTTEESYAATVSEFQDPATELSAHFVNNTDGTITEMVDPANRAWHATYYNNRAIGIENVGYAGQASTWNSKNIASLEKLVAYLAYTYNIPVVHPTDNADDYPSDTLNEPGIVAHAQVQPWDRTDPGPYFPWTRFITDVQTIIKNATTPPPAVQAPFHGTPFAIGSSQVTIQAEDYDIGGEGVAYHDLDKANLGGAYRKSEGVDVEPTTDTGGGYNVGYVKAGEWLEYSLNVAKEGAYNLQPRVAAISEGGKFHIEVNGISVSQSYGVPATGGWQKWTSFNILINLPAGKSVLRIAMDANGSSGSVANFNYFTIAPATPLASGQSPYLGVPFQIASSGSTQIDAALFDNGGEGVAYHDVDAANLGGQFRTTGVDVQTSTGDPSSAYNVGYTKAGEWIEYTINVATAGVYAIDFRVASAGTGGTFHAEVDGANVTGSLTLPNTGGWQTWKTITKTGVTLSAGQHVLRLKMDTNGTTGSVGNFDWLQLTRSA